MSLCSSKRKLITLAHVTFSLMSNAMVFFTSTFVVCISFSVLLFCLIWVYRKQWMIYWSSFDDIDETLLICISAHQINLEIKYLNNSHQRN